MYAQKATIQLSEQGNEVVYMPLGRNTGKAAILYRDDLDRLLVKKGINTRWYCNNDNYPLVVGKQNKRIMIARLLMDAEPEQRVMYRDGNPLNLRRENLYLKDTAHKKITNDIAYVPLRRAW
ncbi:MAG: hypothetical protein C0519_00560 [Hyphomicrobium sp.]|nr:hypothetical protein [Hyphomicrobium sp.]PPD08020.1 MAG: hypothetical protein CTY28_07000 [Hyphomicrobium sp.]